MAWHGMAWHGMAWHGSSTNTLRIFNLETRDNMPRFFLLFKSVI